MVEGLHLKAVPKVWLLRFLLFFVQLSKRVAGAEQFLGDHGEEVTPVPIPNTAVKLLRGGSSWSEGAREISTSPS